MSIEESGITLNFPDSNFFRFQDCQGYTNIQENFKEMDVCWYDVKNDILYVIELKDWGNGILSEEKDPSYSSEDISKLKKNISKSRIEVLFKKSLDSVCMFLSIILNKPYSVNIQNCAPFKVTNTTKIKLLSIINWIDTDTSYISTVHSAYKTYFKPYGKLFGIQSYVVMTKNQAIKSYPWIK
ncbi:MAG: hypothetical protein ACKVOU_07375 [Cytophagales bacterium]